MKNLFTTKQILLFVLQKKTEIIFINTTNCHLKNQQSSLMEFHGTAFQLQLKKEEARNFLLKKYALSSDTHLFLFNGTLDYGPNLEGVKNIVEKINPLFIKKNISYKIIICGKDLPEEMNELESYVSQNIIYAGFVDDISAYFKGADVFINPITNGGGIKTKLVEALGYNLNAVSTFNGAIGIDEGICNGKLLLTKNNDWKDFADKMEIVIEINQSISSAFFQHFYWENIAAKAAEVIGNLE